MNGQQIVLAINWLQLDIDIAQNAKAVVELLDDIRRGNYYHNIKIVPLVGRDKPDSSAEPSLAFGTVWAVVLFVVPARFRVGLFFRGILQVNQLEVVQGTLNRDRPVSIRGGSYYSVSDRSIFVLTCIYIVANRSVSLVQTS
jgi:hypothetical protein